MGISPIDLPGHSVPLVDGAHQGRINSNKPQDRYVSEKTEAKIPLRREIPIDVVVEDLAASLQLQMPGLDEATAAHIAKQLLTRTIERLDVEPEEHPPQHEEHQLDLKA